MVRVGRGTGDLGGLVVGGLGEGREVKAMAARGLVVVGREEWD